MPRPMRRAVLRACTLDPWLRTLAVEGLTLQCRVLQAMRQEEEWEKQFDPDHIDEAEAELNKSQSQILDQVREVGGEEKFDLEAYMKELEESGVKAVLAEVKGFMAEALAPVAVS